MEPRIAKMKCGKIEEGTPLSPKKNLYPNTNQSGFRGEPESIPDG
jgi:hypothetical protein